MIKLSKRMKAVSSMVTPGSILADIGTDHGYVPISLVQRKKIKKAIAMDVNKGPLKRAEEHIREAQLEEYIETRLSDGVKK
ncbi:MAG: SAM-dependent methyltransferase, partial [Agathobacter sp.]|nr:SAM-dependent methyltransferase [Agathobacter sp.]